MNAGKRSIKRQLLAGNSPDTAALSMTGAEGGPMTHYEEHNPLHRPDPDRSGAIPLLLGTVAIALIGILILTNNI